jgi:predicted nucleic acid-binding protein
LYLDANVLVASFTLDEHSDRAQPLLRDEVWEFVVSDLAVTKFSAVVARRVRDRELTRLEALDAFEDIDHWARGSAENVWLTRDDMDFAEDLIRSLDHNILTPDALHLGAARRLDATLATFDRKMGKVAEALGLPLAVI